MLQAGAVKGLKELAFSKQGFTQQVELQIIKVNT